MDLQILENRSRELHKHYRSCNLCPRKCGIDRTSGNTGFCRTDDKPGVPSVGPHFGEEPPLVGRFGSGTIFFSGCNLGCVFCQNDDISHGGSGRKCDSGQLASFMLYLQEVGCHNVNFVTPTHVVPSIVEALVLAIPQGFSLPLVYNCGGYESVDVLRVLEGIIDIYMPDVKFADSTVSNKFTRAADYYERAKEALLEMHRQVGDLTENADSVAIRGLLVRHLVMPHDLAGTEEVMRFLSEDISPDTAVNVMFQYRPCYQAREYTEIARRPRPDECRAALEIASERGLRILR